VLLLLLPPGDGVWHSQCYAIREATVSHQFLPRLWAHHC
jgi:hypothetical protein